MDLYNIVGDADRRAWEEEFAAAARRPVSERLRYAFVRTYKPILDDAPIGRSRAWPMIGAGVKHNCHHG